MENTRNLSRRSFCKATLAGAVLVAASSAATPVLAAEAPKDVKFPKDPKNLAPGQESAHTPSIVIEKTDSAAVAYGKTPPGDFYKVTVQAKHEVTKEHYIFQIALYVNGAQVAVHNMNEAVAESSLPYVVFVQRLKAGDEVLAVTDCNKHGLWGSKLTV